MPHELCHTNHSRPRRTCARTRPRDRGRRRCNRTHAAHSRTVAVATACRADVPHAAAAFGRWRRVGTLGLSARDRGDQPPRRLGRLEHLRRQQFGADRAVPAARDDAHDLRRSARRRRLGAAERVEGDRRAGRLSRHRSMELRFRLPSGHMDGRALPRGGARRLAAAERRGQADGADAAVPVAQATLLDDSWNVIGMRGTMSGSYRLDDVFVPEEFSSTREDPDAAARAWPAVCLSDAGPLCGRCGRRRDGHRARDARCVRGTGDPEDAAQSRPARRQRGGAVERRADGGATGRGTCLSGGDAVRASGRPTKRG